MVYFLLCQRPEVPVPPRQYRRKNYRGLSELLLIVNISGHWSSLILYVDVQALTAYIYSSTDTFADDNTSTKSKRKDNINGAQELSNTTKCIMGGPPQFSLGFWVHLPQPMFSPRKQQA